MPTVDIIAENCGIGSVSKQNSAINNDVVTVVTLFILYPTEMEKDGRSGRAACANFSRLF